MYRCFLKFLRTLYYNIMSAIKLDVKKLAGVDGQQRFAEGVKVSECIKRYKECTIDKIKTSRST